MTHPDELTRLRSAMALVLKSQDLTEVRTLATAALAPPREYAEAQTLADLDPHAWRIVGRHIGDKPSYTIPGDEVSTFQRLRDDGLITSALALRGDYRLILARRLRPAPEARPKAPRRISEIWK
jgi:hypothetical protein